MAPSLSSQPSWREATHLQRWTHTASLTGRWHVMQAALTTSTSSAKKLGHENKNGIFANKQCSVTTVFTKCSQARVYSQVFQSGELSPSLLVDEERWGPNGRQVKKQKRALTKQAEVQESIIQKAGNKTDRSRKGQIYRNQKRNTKTRWSTNHPQGTQFKWISKHNP